MNPVTTSGLDSMRTADILTAANDRLREQGCRCFYHTTPPENSILSNLTAALHTRSHLVQHDILTKVPYTPIMKNSYMH